MIEQGYIYNIRMYSVHLSRDHNLFEVGEIFWSEEDRSSSGAMELFRDPFSRITCTLKRETSALAVHCYCTGMETFMEPFGGTFICVTFEGNFVTERYDPSQDKEPFFTALIATP